ncbi:MAG: DUF4175 family protein, partial [Nitrospinota bacterium]
MDRVHYRRIEHFLRRVALRLRLLTFLERLALWLAVFSVILLGGMALRPLQEWFAYAPLLYSLGSGLLLLLLAGYALIPLLRPYASDFLALLVERQYPWLRNNLINSLQLYPFLEREDPAQRSKGLIQGLLAQTASQVPRLDIGKVVDIRLLYRPFLLAFSLSATLGLVSLLAPLPLQHSLDFLLHPWAHLPPRQTVMEVDVSARRVLTGEPVTVTVTVTGRRPHTLSLRYWEEGRGPEQGKRYQMTAAGGGRFLYTFSQPQKPFHFQVLAPTVSSAVYDVDVLPPPAVANLKLHYFYPAYTDLPPAVREGSGDIEALVGSEVRMEMVANREMVAGRLLFDDGSQLPLTIGENGLIRGNTVVMKSGGYTIEVTDRYGFTNPNPIHYRIQAIPDRHPQVEIVSPPEEITVDESKPIPINYVAQDDFGVKEVYLVYTTPQQEEKKISLQVLSKPRTLLRGEYYWDILGILPTAGGMVSYFLEVWDNDTISGPKKGVSRTHYLKVRSQEEEHERLQELQKEIAESLLNLLGNQLEFSEKLEPFLQEPPSPQEWQRLQQDQQAQRQQARRILSQLEEALRRVERDPMSNYTTFEDLSTLQQNLAFTEKRLMPEMQKALEPLGQRRRPVEAEEEEAIRRAQERLTSELEKMALYADDIAKRSRMQDLENVGQKLLRQQNNLLDSLDRLSRLDQLDPKALQALQKELDEIERLLQSLMEALSQLPSSLPDEFVNNEAIQNLPFDDMQQTLDALRQKLAEGDIEGAKALAQQLLKSLSEMMAALQNAQNLAQSMPFGGQQSNMERAANELTDIVREQQEILRETVRHDKRFTQRINQRQRQDFARLRAQSQPEVDRLLKKNRVLWEELSHSPYFQERPSERLHLSRNYFQMSRELSKVLHNFSPEKVGELF